MPHEHVAVIFVLLVGQLDVTGVVGVGAGAVAFDVVFVVVAFVVAFCVGVVGVGVQVVLIKIVNWPGGFVVFAGQLVQT